MPDRKWFILVDDDTYLIYPSLNFILGHFDPSLPYCKSNDCGPDCPNLFGLEDLFIVISQNH